MSMERARGSEHATLLINSSVSTTTSTTAANAEEHDSLPDDVRAQVQLHAQELRHTYASAVGVDYPPGGPNKCSTTQISGGDCRPFFGDATLDGVQLSLSPVGASSASLQL